MAYTVPSHPLTYHQIDGTSDGISVLAIGVYPDLTLAQARERRDQARAVGEKRRSQRGEAGSQGGHREQLRSSGTRMAYQVFTELDPTSRRQDQ